MQKTISIKGVEIIEPHPIVQELLTFKQSGSVLDLGAGFGRHSLFLADQGFIVTAVEQEEKKLVKLADKASRIGVTIKTITSDVVTFIPPEKYDVVLCIMLLHFLNKTEVARTVTMMQKCTNIGGLNVITSYTEGNATNLRTSLFTKDELKNMYAGWDILKYEELLGQPIDNPKDGGPSQRYSARLIARKI